MNRNIQEPELKQVDLGSDGATGLMEFVHGNSKIVVDPLIETQNLYRISESFHQTDSATGQVTLRDGYEEALRDYVSRILNPESQEVVSVTVALRYSHAITAYCEELKKRTESWLKSLSTLH